MAADPFEALADTYAEQAVLRLLLDGTVRDEYWTTSCADIRRNVDAGDFFHERNGLIYRTMTELLDESGPPDFALVADKLPAHREYVLSLMADVVPTLGGPMLCHGVTYAAKIRERAVRRRALTALQASAAEFYDLNITASEALDRVREKLDMVTAGVDRSTGVFDLGDIYGDVYELYENGGIRGVSTGWRELDCPALEAGQGVYLVSPGEWTLVSGMPSHGKSAWLDALLVNLANSEGWHFAICSPENQPLARHASKLARLKVGKPFNLGYTTRMSHGELSEAISWEFDHFTFVLPHEGKRSVAGVLAVMENVMQRRTVNGLVIDPWNELDHDRPSNMREDEYISKALTQVRNFARRHQVHVWLVAHPTKLQKDPKTGKYPVPRPYDVSGAAHWWNKADNAICVYRDEDDLWVQVHVQKIRFDQNGQKGVAELVYDRATGRYTGGGRHAA